MSRTSAVSHPEPMSRNARACPACGGHDTHLFLTIPDAPVHCNRLCTSAQEAVSVPRRPIDLAFCRSCTLIHHATFDAALLEYDTAYDNSRDCSPSFQRHTSRVAEALIARHDLRGEPVVEIGCGSGGFLRALLDAGAGSAVGIDPAADVARSSPGLRFYAAAYGPEHTDLPAALICCRDVLEHVDRPADWLHLVREGCRPGTTVYCEVPNATYMIHACAGWDVLYEHRSYFTAASLARLFAAAGFEPLRVTETWGGQALSLEARVMEHGEAGRIGSATPIVGSCPLTEEDVAGFAGGYRRSRDEWRERLPALHAAGERPVVWGAGTKGIMFLNALGDAACVVGGVVDVSPRKHGRYIAGTGHAIRPPESLRAAGPHRVLIMNRNYETEIRDSLRRLGISAEARVVAASPEEAAAASEPPRRRRAPAAPWPS